MIRKTVLAFLVVLISVFGSAWADCASHYCNDVKVTGVVSYPDTSIVHVTTNAVESQLTSCTPFGSIYLELDVTKVSGNRTYAMLLAALTSERLVAIAFDSSNPVCEIENVLMF